MTIAENIRFYRKKAGLTQKELGNLSGTSETTIKQYELGKRQPRIEQLEKIAKALNTHILVLLGQISSDFAYSLQSSNIDIRDAYLAIFKDIYGEIDIKQVNEDGIAYYYVLGKNDRKITISELTYSNIEETIENIIKLSVNIANNNDSQECFTLIDIIKNMNLEDLKKISEYATFISSKYN